MAARKKVKKALPYRKCAIFIGLLGLLQSIVWITFAVLYINMYHLSRKTTFMKEVKAFRIGHIYWKTFYNRFIVPRSPDSNKIRFYFYAYFALSLFWFVSSMYLLCVGCNDDCVGHGRNAYVSWGSLTFIICIVDSIATFLIVSDITRMANEKQKDYVPQPRDKNYPPDVRLSVLLVISFFLARGFFIWILNLICSLLLLMASRRKKRRKKARTGICTTCPEAQEVPQRQLPCSILCSGVSDRPEDPCTRAGIPPGAPVVTLAMIKNMFDVTTDSGGLDRICVWKK